MKTSVKPLLVAICSLITLTIAGSAMASAQTTASMKLGVVDSEKILADMAEVKQVEAQVMNLQKAFMDTLNAYDAHYKTLVEKYQKEEKLMNAETKAAEEKKIMGIREEALRYQQDRLGQQGALYQVQAQLLQPVREKVRAAIEVVAKEEKLSAVVEHSLVIYYDNKLDITYKVLDQLRRGNK